jgi:hypothetical protein
MTFQFLQDNQNNRRNSFSNELKNALCSIWLGISNLFQTFEELDSVQDKAGEIAQIRHLLDDTVDELTNIVSGEPKDGNR